MYCAVYGTLSYSSHPKASEDYHRGRGGGERRKSGGGGGMSVFSHFSLFALLQLEVHRMVPLPFSVHHLSPTEILNPVK